jgi:hypothetical protein
VSHRARLDVSAPVLQAVTGWIARHRRRFGCRPSQRAGTVHTQVVLVLRWLRHRLDLRTLALQAKVSIATAYRYLHEGLDVIAARGPDLLDVLGRAHAGGALFLCLEGTLIPTDRVAVRAEVDGKPAITCGSPASTGPSEATCRCSPITPASRCGSPTYDPVPPST